MANPIVVDLSHHQADPIDWVALSDGGTLGVILKCTEGSTYVDPTYQQRRKDAQECGLLVASYHFLKHGNISGQMEWYMEQSMYDDGDRMVIDYEDTDCTFDDLEQSVEYLQAGGDVEVAVYGSNHLVDSVAGQKSNILSKTSLWQARYSETPPNVPTNIWPTWSLWQFTDEANVTGLDVPVDGNKWNGDPDALEDWFYRPDSMPSPEPDDTPVVTVSLNVTSTSPVMLKVVINGEEVEVV